jgi:hypothetical protein
MAIINRSYITSLLRPGLHAVFGDFETYPDLWKEIYSQHTSDKAVEYEIELQGLPLAQLKPDGAPVAMGQMNQVYETQYINSFYGIGFQITRAAIEDNLYKDQFPQQALNLRNSLSTVKNTNGAYLFNNAFNANSTGSDGQPLCSTQHPTAQGTLANTFSNGVGLNESSLEDAITIIKSWTNVAGLRINMSPVKLLVPQAGAFQASRILNSQYRTGTTNNDINAIVHDKYLPGGFIVNQFILNPNFWGILTDEANGFKYFQRSKVDIDFITDPNTDNVTVRAIERYAMNFSNWRAFFGSVGA